MAFTLTTITHAFMDVTGAPATGRVVFTLTKGMTNNRTTMLPIGVVAELNEDGIITQDLTSNVDLGTDPSDAQYRVDLRLNGVQPLTYFITVPTGSDNTPYPIVDLGLLLPSEGSTVPVDVTTQWSQYLDVDMDVKPFLAIQPGTEKYDRSLQSITAMACQWVQRYTGQPVPPTQFNRKFNGWTGMDGCYVQLPYFPVVGTPTVTEWWGMSGPHVLTEQTPEHQSNTAHGNFGDVYQIDRLKGLIIRTFPGLIQRPFFPGLRNIEIQWVGGYNPVPDDLRLATLELIDYWYRNTQEAVRTAQTGAYGEASPNNVWKAVPNRVSQLLQPYTHIAIG